MFKTGVRIGELSALRVCDYIVSIHATETILLDGNVKESTILGTMGHADINCAKGHYYFDRSGIEDKRKELDSIKEL